MWSNRKGFWVCIALMLGLGLLAYCIGCKRVNSEVVSPTPNESPASSAEVTASPSSPSPTPTATITPPVAHVSPKPQPTPDAVSVLKAEVMKQPSVQRTRWEKVKIKPVFEIAVNKAVMLYMRTKDRYTVVEKMRVHGVPAPVLFCLHYRESDNDFTCHPHEGSSLQHRTRYVPKGRLPPPKNPPYKWEDSAEDAYYVADDLQGPWYDLPWAFRAMERFNGMGYQKRGKDSPYNWSGTQYYDSGKFVSDGHYSSTAVDKQLGCVAILHRMKERGIPIAFD